MKNTKLIKNFFLLPLVVLLSTSVSYGAEPKRLDVPSDVAAPPWLETRAAAQIAAVAELDVFHQFSFSDQLEQSGIRFRNYMTDESGKSWQPVHYDHGNGVAVADVDGDGRSDIYFTTQAGGNQLWKNLGGGKFVDITATAGVAVPDPIGVGASFADVDNDGDPDLYVTTIRAGNVLFENDGNGKFTDISARSGLDYKGHSSGALFFDYNRDGRLDLFLTNVGTYTTDVAIPSQTYSGGSGEDIEYEYYVGLSDAFSSHLKPERFEQSVLYRNEGDNRFVDVSAEAKLLDMSWSGDACPSDLNEDGWIDLYVLNMQGHDHYYENVEGKYFVDKSREVFPKTPWGAMGIEVFDYNNDGSMDIFITDMHSDMSEKVGPEGEKDKANMTYPESFLLSGGNSLYGNAFYENKGDGSFAEISDQIGAENYWPWGLSAGDLNADGYEDVFIASSMNYPYRYSLNSVLLNDGGKKFVDSEFVLGVEPRPNGQIVRPWFELDCADADRNHRDCKEQSGQVVVWGALGSRASVIFDLDGDGDLDIVTNEFNSEPMVLISSLSEVKPIRYLNVELQGSKSNRSGLGARVAVQVGSQTYTKVRDGKSGYLSQSLYPLYFGLANAAVVDQIEVLWPSGQRQVVAGPIETNKTLVIKEP